MRVRGRFIYVLIYIVPMCNCRIEKIRSLIITNYLSLCTSRGPGRPYEFTKNMCNNNAHVLRMTLIKTLINFKPCLALNLKSNLCTVYHVLAQLVNHKKGLRPWCDCPRTSYRRSKTLSACKVDLNKVVGWSEHRVRPRPGSTKISHRITKTDQGNNGIETVRAKGNRARQYPPIIKRQTWPKSVITWVRTKLTAGKTNILLPPRGIEPTTSMSLRHDSMMLPLHQGQLTLVSKKSTPHISPRRPLQIDQTKPPNTLQSRKTSTYNNQDKTKINTLLTETVGGAPECDS